MLADTHKYCGKFLSFYASVAKSHHLVPRNPEESDQLIDHLIMHKQGPLKFGEGRLQRQTSLPDHWSFDSPVASESVVKDHLELSEAEVTDIAVKNTKVNAKFESFTNLLNFKTITNFLKYWLSSKQTHIDSKLFFLNRENQLLQHAFNMIDIKAMKHVRHFTLEKCKTKLKWYLCPHIFNSIFKLFKNKPLQFKPTPNDTEILIGLNELFQNKLLEENHAFVMIRFLLDAPVELFSQMMEKLHAAYLPATNSSKNSPQVNRNSLGETIISPSTMSPSQMSPDFGGSSPFSKPIQGSSPASNPSAANKKKYLIVDPDDLEKFKIELPASEKKHFSTILIHFHGGGFVGMSTSSHQVYLRKWAAELKIPIFSVDYRLAPQVQYPFLINDCIRSYVFILILLTQVFKIDVKKIVLAGDSAGANISMAITTWCIENKFRKPDELHTIYPACSLARLEFTPSLLYSIEDYLLHYSVLHGLLEMYVPADIDSAADYYTSPLKIPDAILAEYPPLHSYLCERDPLRDNGIRMLLRLIKQNRLVQMHYFKYTMHGVLNMVGKKNFQSMDAAVFLTEELTKAMKKSIFSNIQI